MRSPTVLGTRLDIILLAIQAQLMAWLDWPEERVILNSPKVVDALEYDPQADAYLVVWPESQQRLDRGVFEGACRQDTRFIVRLLVEVRTRAGLDETVSRQTWLTDQGLGHVASGQFPVCDALIGFNVIDDDENALTIGPLMCTEIQSPDSEPKKYEWGRSKVYFEFQYLLGLTLPPY